MDKYKKNEMVFKAFCDESRLKILDILKNGELCSVDILKILNIKQSTLSHHIKVLCESGVLSGRREGKWIYYYINKEGLDKAIDLIKELYE